MQTYSWRCGCSGQRQGDVHRLSRVLDSFAVLSFLEQLLIAYILMANIYTYGISYSNVVMLLSILYILSHLTLISKI